MQVLYPPFYSNNYFYQLESISAIVVDQKRSIFIYKVAPSSQAHTRFLVVLPDD